jgi:hypothetical protein
MDSSIVLAPVPHVYQVYGTEDCPTTNREHIQGYIVFKDGKTLSSVKTMFNSSSIHLSVPRASAEINMRYCSKGRDIIQTGIMPRSGRRNDLQAIRELVLADAKLIDILEISTNLQQIKTAEILFRHFEKKRNWKPEVV